MIRPASYLPVLLSCFFAACASQPGGRQIASPEAATRELTRQEIEAKQNRFEAILVRLDQAMESYVTALGNRGDQRADAHIKSLNDLLRNEVLDLGARNRNGKADPNDREPGENFRRLRALAADGTYPDKQAIALAALGFSGRRDIMPVIVQGALLNDPFVVDHAVLGLAILRAPDTPAGVLAKIIDNPKHPEDGRVQAAWALYQIQTASTDPTEIVALWRGYLGADRDRRPPGIMVAAVRGLGLTADIEHAKLIAPLLKHPIPRVRMTTAIALGRMNAQEYWPDLLSLLKPQESVQNVRLHARKALSALAGNQDHGYDISAWRKIFDRGEKAADGR